MTGNKQFNLHIDLVNNCFIVGDDCKFGMFDKLEREQCLRIIDKLNEMDSRIKELEKENAELLNSIVSLRAINDELRGILGDIKWEVKQ